MTQVLAHGTHQSPYKDRQTPGDPHETKGIQAKYWWNIAPTCIRVSLLCMKLVIHSPMWKSPVQFTGRPATGCQRPPRCYLAKSHLHSTLQSRARHLVTAKRCG